MRIRVVARNLLLVGAAAMTFITAVRSDAIGAGSDPPTASAVPSEPLTHADLAPTPLTVMTFNVWLGGAIVDIAQVAEVIRESGADVVGLQESDGNARRIAELVGWPHVDERLQVISRYPLITPPEAEGEYAYVQLAPGQVVALANIHLPSDPYGPYLVRDGSTAEQVLENEVETRMWRVDELSPGWQRAIDAGIPLLLTGDFNSPSHRDWTSGAIRTRPHIAYAVDWPVSHAVESLGFVDTYRSVHPDPVANPGITWSFGYPYPRIDHGEAQDRIDFIYVSGASEVVTSEIVGPRGVGDVSIAVDPYPSDHLAVVSTVVVDPVEPAPFVSVADVRTEIGDPLGIYYHAPGGQDTDRIVLVPSGGNPAIDGFGSLPPAEASYFGRITMGTGGRTAGEYEAVLLTVDGRGNPVEVSRTRFWLVAPGAAPSVSVAAGDLAPGEPVEVTWDAALARKFDWIGVFPADDPDLYGYLAFVYTGATVSGGYAFGPDDLGDAMLPPGDYVVRLMSDDSYITLAEASFTVS